MFLEGDVYHIKTGFSRTGEAPVVHLLWSVTHVNNVRALDSVSPCGSKTLQLPPSASEEEQLQQRCAD